MKRRCFALLLALLLCFSLAACAVKTVPVKRDAESETFPADPSESAAPTDPVDLPEAGTPEPEAPTDALTAYLLQTSAVATETLAESALDSTQISLYTTSPELLAAVSAYGQAQQAGEPLGAVLLKLPESAYQGIIPGSQRGLSARTVQRLRNLAVCQPVIQWFADRYGTTAVAAATVLNSLSRGSCPLPEGMDAPYLCALVYEGAVCWTAFLPDPNGIVAHPCYAAAVDGSKLLEEPTALLSEMGYTLTETEPQFYEGAALTELLETPAKVETVRVPAYTGSEEDFIAEIAQTALDLTAEYTGLPALRSSYSEDCAVAIAAICSRAESEPLEALAFDAAPERLESSFNTMLEAMLDSGYLSRDEIPEQMNEMLQRMIPNLGTLLYNYAAAAAGGRSQAEIIAANMATLTFTMPCPKGFEDQLILVRFPEGETAFLLYAQRDGEVVSVSSSYTVDWLRAEINPNGDEEMEMLWRLIVEPLTENTATVPLS